MSEIDTGGYVNSLSLLGNAHYGITRRDQCADRIAASIACDLAMYDKEIEDSVAQWISRISYKLADSQIAEGKKNGEKLACPVCGVSPRTCGH